MSDQHAPEPTGCEIRLRGHLDERWQESFQGLRLTHEIEQDGVPVTVLRGPVADEAELHGLLTRIRDLGIPLLAVTRAPGGRDEGHQGRLAALPSTKPT